MSHTDGVTRVADAHEDDLGLLLFQGKPSIARGVVFVVIGLAWLLLSFGLMFLNSDPRAPLIGGLGALMSTIFIAIGVVYLAPRVGSVFFFHERGLKQLLRGRQRVLKYEDVAELTLCTQRIYYEGTYLSTPARLTLRSTDRREKLFIINQGNRETADSATPNDLLGVCFHIARILAARWAEQVERGHDVEWTSKMRIHADGIEVRDGTIITRDGRWVPNLVPWDKVACADIEDGLFRLLVEGERQYRVIVRSDTPNFYPGYLYVVSRLSDSR